MIPRSIFKRTTLIQAIRGAMCDCYCGSSHRQTTPVSTYWLFRWFETQQLTTHLKWDNLVEIVGICSLTGPTATSRESDIG